MAKISKKTINAAAKAERDLLKSRTKDASPRSRRKTRDSYQNFAINLGMGTDNVLSASTYGFNPITRNRTLLEWIHRGSWLGGMAVDIPADDMVRAGVDITCDADPEQVDGVQQDLVRLGTWTGLRDTVAWSRLYGGAIGVIMIDGQDYSQPLDPERIGKGQFRGVQALDRWMVEPSLGDLVAEQGPHLGLPKFYRVTSDIPGLRMKTVHYTRVIRFDGIRLPYWQRVSENLWGISVLERLYDRMVAFDSTTQGAAQLSYKSYLRTIKIKGLRDILAEGGPAETVLTQYVDMMRRYQSIEGMTMLDGDDDFVPHSNVNMSGMSEIMLQMGQQLSGALQIPLVRLFGQSPAGLNSTGESDLRTYYDGIAQQQAEKLLVPMHVIVRAAALSGGWKIPDDFDVIFRPLWQLSEEQKSEVANRDTQTIAQAEERGLVSQRTAMSELKQQSKVTGRFTNISDEEIEEASDELAPRGEDAILQEQEAMAGREEIVGDDGDDQDRNDPKEPKEPKTTKDARGGLPSSLQSLWNANRDKIQEIFVEKDPGSPASYWLYLKPGWTCRSMGCGTIHEDTVADVIRQFKTVHKDSVHDAKFEVSYEVDGKNETRIVESPSFDGARRRFVNMANKEGLSGVKILSVKKTQDSSLPYSQICGLDVAIETPRGTVRRGRDAEGRSWESVMPADYGYIRRAPSAEGATEWLDCFVGPVRDENCPVHVVDGYDPLGDFDEHKVMLGFPSRSAALRAYHDAYGDGRRAGDVTTMTIDELRAWFTTADMTKPIGQRNLRLAANGA